MYQGVSTETNLLSNYCHFHLEDSSEIIKLFMTDCSYIVPDSTLLSNRVSPLRLKMPLRKDCIESSTLLPN